MMAGFSCLLEFAKFGGEGLFLSFVDGKVSHVQNLVQPTLDPFLAYYFINLFPTKTEPRPSIKTPNKYKIKTQINNYQNTSPRQRRQKLDSAQAHAQVDVVLSSSKVTYKKPSIDPTET